MMTRRWSNRVGVLLIAPLFAGLAQNADEAADLVRQIGQFQPAIDGRLQSDSGLPMPAEQQRAAIWAKLRALGDQAVVPLQQGLTGSEVQVRQNVALYLLMEGMRIPQSTMDLVGVRQ